MKKLISKIPIILKILLDIPFSYSNILKKSKIKINKNILNNYSSSISNRENKNPNYINGYLIYIIINEKSNKDIKNILNS